LRQKIRRPAGRAGLYAPLPINRVADLADSILYVTRRLVRGAGGLVRLAFSLEFGVTNGLAATSLTTPATF
jgi:hypothetical protein